MVQRRREGADPDEGHDPRGTRYALATLSVVIVLGAQALWLLIPAATLWVIGRIVDTTEQAFFAAMVATPVALVAFAWLLGSANRRYRQLAGRDGGRGPLEAVLPVTVVLALIAGTVWLIAFAGHAPTGREQLIP